MRLKVLEHLHKVVDTIGTASLEKFIVGALLSLGVDALWRVREKVVEQLPLMAKALVRGAWLHVPLRYGR